MKDDFYFPLGEYLKITHQLLKMWEVTVKPENTKLSTASQVVTTSSEPAKSTETLHSTGFWESAQPIPRMEEGVTVVTATTSPPKVTEIPMDVDEDVIFVDVKMSHSW